MNTIKNSLLSQIGILLLICFLGVIIVWKLAYFIPGFLGATALYIMLRSWYFKLVEDRKWKQWIAGLVLIAGLLIAMVGPLFLLVEVLTPKVNQMVANADQIKASVLKVIEYVQQKFPQVRVSKQQIDGAVQKGLTFIPKILDATANVLANIFTALFIFYFMLMGGRNMEKTFKDYIPLTRRNRYEIWKETQNMVISNSLGIPFLALAQGLVALIGYLVCGVPGAVLWALLTGLATIIPVLGTMIIWVPICIYLLSIGDVPYAIGLAIYCFVIVGMTDNVLRFIFLKKFGDVHPLITVFGVILGLNIFGLMGLIFGPLILSYFIMLIKIYKSEYGDDAETAAKV